MSKNRSVYLNVAVFFAMVLLATSCPQNCLFCFKDDTCITCQNLFFLTILSKCVPKTVQNCRVYFEAGKCAICEPTFQVNNNQCIKDFSGCLLRDKNGVCQQCAFGTTLDIKGQCLGVINCALPQKNCKTCRTGYNLVNNKCIYLGNDCQVVQSNGLCSQCKIGFTLNGFECVSKVTNSAANGNLNLIEKCSLYSRSQNICLQCEKGYQFLGNRCVSAGELYNKTIDAADNKIRQTSQVAFVDTASEFIKYSQITYSLSNKKDDVIDPNQKVQTKVIFQGVGTEPRETNNGDQGNSDSLNGGNNGASTKGATNIIEGCLIQAKDTLGCSVCIDGYYFFNGMCKKKTPVCTKFNTTSNKCQACHDTFALVNGDCEDLGCETYLYSQCAKCKPGFLVNQEGYCFDPYCLAKSQGNCVKCLNGHEIDSKTKLCYKTIPGCSVYNSEKTACTQCQTNFSLANGACSRIEDEKCLMYNSKNSQECIRCRDGFSLMQGACIDLYCRVFDSNGKCKTCKEGYMLQSLGYCLDQNCVLYSNGTCINCANNFRLQEGFCVNVLIGCSRVEASSQKCVNCLNEYRLFEGRCIFSDNQRCLQYSNSLCVSCKIEYALVNGTCVDLLCEKETLFNNYYACQKCKAGYNLTAEGLCYDENCYRSANGSCTWCADNYVIGQNGLCVKSTVGCLNWNQTENRCITCFTGYIVAKNGVCIVSTANTNINSSMNTSTNTNSSTNTNPSTTTTPTNPAVTPSRYDPVDTLTDKDIEVPKPTDSNCKQYDTTNSNCLKCIEGRYFIRNGKCQPVPQICKGFDMRSGNCTSCQTNYATYTEQSLYQDCFKKLDSDPNCTRKNTNFFCIKCKAGFYIKAGYCYTADTLCKTFDLYGGECLTCYQGYTLQKDKCIPLTKQSKCRTYDFQNVCIECENRYFVDKAGVCKQIGTACLTYQMLGGNCLTCQVGYWPANGVCFKVKDPVPNCKASNELGNCIQCQNRYYLDSVSLICKTVSSLCNDYNTSTGACLNCSTGYKLRGDLGVCVVENSEDNCVAFTQNGYCSKCPNNYVLTQQFKCIKVSPLCATYNSETGECEKCVDTHYLSFKECLIKFKKDSLDPNCLLGDSNNFCIKCKPAFYINSGNCLKANDQCKTFNMNTGACETCYDGYVVKSKECVLISPSQVEDNCELKSGSLCIKCKDRFYLSYGSSLPTCAKVNSLCKTYNQYNGDCYSCVDGYSLNNGACIQTNTTPTTISYIDVPQVFCKQYDLAAKYCKTCYGGYYYSTTLQICTPVSPDCRTYNTTNGWCISCFEGYYLNNNQCVIKGTDSIKLSEDRIDSSPNQLYCQKFNTATGKCITCYNGYQLLSTGACSLTSNPDPYCTSFSDGKCVNCLPGYFVDTKTNLCTLQNLLCETYAMSGGLCTKCKVGSVLQDGICVKPALGVDPYCSFYDGAYCFSCVTGYKLINFICQKV